MLLNFSTSVLIIYKLLEEDQKLLKHICSFDLLDFINVYKIFINCLNFELL